MLGYATGRRLTARARSPRGQDRRRPGWIDFEAGPVATADQPGQHRPRRPGLPVRPLGVRGADPERLPGAGHLDQAGGRVVPAGERPGDVRQPLGGEAVRPVGDPVPDAQVHVVDLQLRQPPRQRVPGRVRLPANAVHAGLPGRLRQARGLGRQRRGRLRDVGAQFGRGTPRSGLDVLVAGGGARVLRRHHPGTRPGQQVAQPVRAAREVGQQVPAGPAGQQRGLPRPRVGDRGRARKQPPGRLVYPAAKHRRVRSGSHAAMLQVRQAHRGRAAGTPAGLRPGAAVRRHLEGHHPGRGEGGNVLTRALVSVLAAGLAAVLMLAAGQQAALAGGGPGGGNLVGSVTCGQSYSPQCDVTAGSGPSAGTPAGPGTQAGGQQAARTAAGAGAAPPDPAVLAALARQTLGLPSPVIRSSPAQNALQLTNLPTWLWINPAEWVPESKTATVPGESVTATATPVSVTWHPGDGSTVTCQGAGTPYTSADNAAAASPDCGHTYTSSSAGQPGGAFQVTATITWDIAWQG